MDMTDDTTDVGGANLFIPCVVEKMVHGDIKLGLFITKGQLEIDTICAKGLSTSTHPPGNFKLLLSQSHGKILPLCYMRCFFRHDDPATHPSL